MNLLSRTITGIIISLLGGSILTAALTEQSMYGLVAAGIGLFCIGIGVYLFFHTKEDSIEEVDKQ